MITNQQAKERISYHLRAILKRRGKSQMWLSEQTGDSQNGVNQACLGRNVPSSARLCRMAKALGVKMDDLLRPIKKSRKKKAKSA